jgi:acyl-CoA dehydrogenase
MDIFGRSEEIGTLVSAIQQFMSTHVLPHEDPALEHDVAALDALSMKLRALARDAGLWGPRLPADLGGMGLNWRDSQAVLEQAGRSPLGPLALHCAPPDGPNIEMIASLASPAQQEQFLAPLIAGTMRSCFAMTEPAPGVGSDPKMLSTTATRDNGGWMIDGHKWFISGAQGASVAIVMAMADKGPTFFLVNTDNPGWHHIRNIRAMDGYQAGGHGEIKLEQCWVNDDAVLGKIGQGFAYAQARLEPARLAHCMRLVGRAARAMEIAEAYIVERESFGRRVSEHQLAQALVADSHIELTAARLMTWHVAARLDAGLSVKHESAMAKVFVSEKIEAIVDRAVQLLGARGISDDTPVAGFYRELRAFRVFDGASEVHRAAIGKRVLRKHA